MDHLLHILNRIEELLGELIIAEVKGAMIEPKGFDVIHNLVHVCCELVNTLSEGVGLPPFPKIIRDKGVHLELEKEVVGREGVTFITAFLHAIDEETLSIPESLPDLLEEEESQPRSSLDSFEEFVRLGIISREVSPYCVTSRPNRIWFY